MVSRLAIIAAAAFLGACSSSDHVSRNVCNGTVPCGYFDIQNIKESSPVFFGVAAASPGYRICVDEGSVILQTIEADGSARSLGGEIRSGNCTDMSFADQIYIIGNTSNGRSAGFYYRVP